MSDDLSKLPGQPKSDDVTLPKYKRKCENWLVDFGRWTLPRSEAPQTFIFWTGLFTLACAVRRHIKIPQSYLGSWEVSPNLYILFIAGAGKARKSTTANYAEDLLDEIQDLTRSPELITKESLLSTLVLAPDSSMAIIAPEFGEFIVKSGVEMFGFLTNMYDGKKRISASTLSRGKEFVDRPCVNLIGATTPEWVADNMPESVIGGGFASRVIFIFEEKVRRRQLFYESLDQDAMNRIRDNLISDLDYISRNIQGEFSIDDDGKEFMEAWYRANADAGSADQYKLSGYFERRPAHIFKVAMLVHVARSDDMILAKRDFEEAINLLKQIEKTLPMTFRSIGRNPYTIDMMRILDYVKEQDRVSISDIKAKFFHIAEPGKIDELLTGLFQAGFVKVDVVEGITYYKM